MTIGIIGTGWGVRVQVPCFRAAGLEVSAIAGRDAVKTAQAAVQHQIAFATANWRELIARPEIQIVSIVTPPNLHAEMSIAALEAGKHVLCEKPTAMNAEEAARMNEAAKAHPDQFALIDHELRFAPSLLKLRNLIASGEMGTVRYVTLQLMSAGRADPKRAWNWWSDAGQGGGLLGAVGSHNVDTLRFVLSAEVEQVGALIRTFITERPGADGKPQPVTSDDYYQLRLHFVGGALATAEVNMTVQPEEPNTFTVYGTKGSLRWQNGKLSHSEAGKPFVDITPRHLYPPATPDLASDFPHATVYLAHAIKAYLGGEKQALAVGATFQDGLHIQRVLDAARVSNTAGGALHLV